jgi:hypothetical protein
MSDPTRCYATNDLLGLRFDREAGHDGAHIQMDDNSSQAWGYAR